MSSCVLQNEICQSLPVTGVLNEYGNEPSLMLSLEHLNLFSFIANACSQRRLYKYSDFFSG